MEGNTRLSSYGVKRLVLDVLKRYTPNIVDLANHLCTQTEVEGITIISVEFDVETESVKITIEVNNLDIEPIKLMLETDGAIIQSVDQVIVTKDTFEQNELVEDI